MLPTIYPIISAAPAVTALIGSNPSRFYRHGVAPQNVAAPYCTWSVISGAPENALDEAPRIDAYNIQIDCWSDNAGGGDEGVEVLAKAVRDAIEPHAYMTGVVANERDFETMRYRIGMTFTFWTHRT